MSADLVETAVWITKEVCDTRAVGLLASVAPAAGRKREGKWGKVDDVTAAVGS